MLEGPLPEVPKLPVMIPDTKLTGLPIASAPRYRKLLESRSPLVFVPAESELSSEPSALPATCPTIQLLAAVVCLAIRRP